MIGDFDADLASEPVEPPSFKPEPDHNPPINSGGDQGAGGTPGPEDDDIPF